MPQNSPHPLPPLARTAHAAHATRCLSGLPGSQTDIDASRVALVFYCLGSLDLLGLLDSKVPELDRQEWTEWLWEQQTRGPFGTGFKPGSFMTSRPDQEGSADESNYNCPHIIMTYTAMLSLAILRDDFSRLDRRGITSFLRSCQKDDGSFSTTPQSTDSDLRTVYCAFAISSMLNDWSGMDVGRAIAFIDSCRTYEGGYGQSPFCEAQGGTTYTAIASLYLAPQGNSNGEHLTAAQREQTIRWLVSNQQTSGGFRGRTAKEADACYCFWCGGALQILGEPDLVNRTSLANFMARCQFKYGGISKAPGENPDPYHTYLSLAALSMYPPANDAGSNPSWQFERLDPLLNARETTVRWIKEHIPSNPQVSQ
ncbi:hypothetical protein HGRIS_005955 [Hohenbuehelia grisea]|uniref:Prenyltransferase alpha-alpha toroid domain-containing protein n=1 Tax=Hohenbuehelia grisea TaxID=104357 RepID=A0ABR3K0K4_9AGAR